MLRSRQLAAIMFTDIQGYTALMQQDEQLAVQYRDKHRRIFNAATEKYNGRVLQYYGDGTLSIFDSALDAVHCGIEMQKGFRDTPVIPVRIGIHSGDIIYSDEEIIGDSVNVASRIESLAVAGSVFVSDKVYDDIKNQPDIRTIRLKTFHLKNVERPVDVYAIANEGLVVPEAANIKGKTEPDKSTDTNKTTAPAKKDNRPRPFLATKLFVPPHRPGAVQRSRLTDRLQQGLNGKLSLICAPAGFGKTTLISEWAAAGQQPLAWLSLEEADSNLSRFLSYFIAALQSVQEHIGENILGLVQSPQPPPTDQLLAMLINELTLLQERMILVLDDYHLIDSRAVNEALAYLLDHLPPQLHLIITTREDPVLPLSRLRVRGQLTEFRAADLRFTAVEAAEFLNHAMGLQLSAEDVAALEVRTEGWIAGLQMAALSMQGRSDTSQFISAFTGSHRFILDYLVEEVLLGQPEEVRSFLIQTAILNRLCGPLCNAVTGRTDGDALLADLERENLFIIPLDDQRQWYRYHHLFSEMLRAHAAREQASQLPLFHRRAGKWYAENDSMPEAVQHALASEDVAWAADMIEQVWPAMDAQFQADLWLIWFEKIPTAITANRPVLLGAAAWAYLNRGELEAGAINIAQSQELLDQISSAENVGNAPEHIVVADPAQFKFLSASLASARAYLALAHGDIPFTLQHARYALDLYGKEDYVQRGPAAALLGLASWSIGDLETAHRALTEAMHDFERARSMEFAISGTYGLADIRIAQGRLRDAIRTYEQVLDLVNKKGLQHIRGTADLYLGLGKLSLERGETEKATQLVQTSEEMGPQLALPDWPCRLRIAKAHLEEARGEWDTALELLDQAGRLYYPTPIPLTHPISARKAQIWVKQGRLSLAHNWVREQDLSADDPLHYLKEFEHLTLVRILLATYRSEGSVQRLQEAQTLLERLQSAAEQGERIGSVIHILILRALTHEAQSDLAAAMPPLKKALTLAAPEEYVQTFISEGPPMLRLLSEAARLGILPDYTNRLLKASGQELFTPSFSPTSLSAKTTLVQALIEPLSDRELEILQLIANGLSNQEISRKLFLALSTVKGHNRNIFGKLEVQRRTEAVARGRELGLIE